MPLYEYACRKCEYTFEELVRNGEAVECPECHGQQVERLLSVPGPPKVVSQPLPMTCNPAAPPCGPGCCKL